MRVDQQTAIEGAPSLILADGEGGVTYHLVTDEAILAAAGSIAEKNDWTDEERTGLYQAVCGLLEVIGVEGGNQ